MMIHSVGGDGGHTDGDGVDDGLGDGGYGDGGGDGVDVDKCG